ncbi:MAG: hypothetical protein COA58_04285 [Bacteroidetes bacterium]|nr:MAG: hypothetical protein COA58_04285 [Bacteroidota bacterium]
MRMNTIKRNITLVVIILTVAGGCKEGENTSPNTPPGGTGSGNGSSNKEQVLMDYQDVYLANFINPSLSVWEDGDLANCNAGSISAATNQKVLTLINYYRKLVGLPGTVTFEATRNQKCQEAAFMMTANNALNHQPPSSWNCYTANGAEGALRSNLAWGHTTAGLFSQMRDDGSGNYFAGHRRLILSPKGNVFGHGSTNKHMALWVIDSKSAANAPEFIAWPPQGFCPSAFNFKRWSFSVVGGANYENAVVSIKDVNGNNIDLSMENFLTGFGEDTIVWVPQGVQNDMEYTITISNVEVNGKTETYTYKTTLVSV